MITIYGVTGSRAFRSLWMLEELGLDYEQVPTHFATGDCKKPDYLKLNPNGHIPTLVDGDVVMWESMAINLYLAKKYDGGLLPKSLVDESHAIKWSIWAMTEVEELLVSVVIHRMLFPEAERKPAVADQAEQKLAKPFAVVDAALAGRDYLVGESYSVADVNLASVLAWAPFCSVDFSRFPNVARWLEACTARPAAQKVLAMLQDTAG